MEMFGFPEGKQRADAKTDSEESKETLVLWKMYLIFHLSRKLILSKQLFYI